MKEDDISTARKNQLIVLNSISVWEDENIRNGFKIKEIQEHTYEVSDRSVRRIIKEQHLLGYIKKEEGLYIPVQILKDI